MTLLNMLDAKTNLTKMIKQLETNQEEEFIICRNGVPCAKLVYYEKNESKRVLGRCNGKYKMPNDEQWQEMKDDMSFDIDNNLENIKL